jgi:hypothetical protein
LISTSSHSAGSPALSGQSQTLPSVVKPFLEPTAYREPAPAAGADALKNVEQPVPNKDTPATNITNSDFRIINSS